MLRNGAVDEWRQICSEQTLQSEKEGHFARFAGAVAAANPGMLKTLNQMDTDEERMLFVSQLHKVDHFIVQPVFKKKNAELARAKRSEGNDAFQKKRYKQAMNLYSMASCKAPDGDETVAYSVANRSACHFYLGDLKSCLQDIEYALSLNYPTQLAYKLHERKIKALLHLGRMDEARAAFHVAKKNLDAHKDKLDEKKAKQAVNALKTLYATIESGKKPDDETLALDESWQPTVVPKLTSGPNKKLRDLSNLVKVERGNIVGRHVVAAKPVATGDVLVVEDPVGAVLYADKLGSHCDNCFGKLSASVACKRCAGVAYCSVACREEAAPSHRYECQYMDLIYGLGGSALVRLAYRIVAAKSLKFFNAIKHNLVVDEESTEQTGATPSYSIQGVKKTDYTNYLSTFNLVGLDSKRWTEDTFHRALMAICLLKILKAAKYFPHNKEDVDVFTNDELFVGSLMMRHLNVLQFNAHEIYELLRGDRRNMKPNKNLLIGLGVYPQASFFNHSCHPRTARYNIGKKLVLKALTPFQPGEEVSENYGQVFYFKSKQERQRELEARYWFKCECPACKDDWPLLKENKKVCWRGEPDESALEDLKTLFDCGVDFMDHGQAADATGSLEEYVDAVYKLINPPLEIVVRAEDKLRTCYNNMGTVIFQDTILKTNPQERRVPG